MQKHDATEITIYPNPTSEKLSIEVKTTETGTIYAEVLNITGRQIQTTEIINNKADIDVAGMSSGCYLLNCYRNGVRISTATFVKN